VFSGRVRCSEVIVASSPSPEEHYLSGCDIVWLTSQRNTQPPYTGSKIFEADNDQEASSNVFLNPLMHEIHLHDSVPTSQNIPLKDQSLFLVTVIQNTVGGMLSFWMLKQMGRVKKLIVVQFVKKLPVSSLQSSHGHATDLNPEPLKSNPHH
jgi:hypothetical protein